MIATVGRFVNDEVVPLAMPGQRDGYTWVAQCYRTGVLIGTAVSDSNRGEVSFTAVNSGRLFYFTVEHGLPPYGIESHRIPAPKMVCAGDRVILRVRPELIITTGGK